MLIVLSTTMDQANAFLAGRVGVPRIPSRPVGSSTCEMLLSPSLALSTATRLSQGRIVGEVFKTS